jgi:putative ABC transport system permease protein
VTSSRETLERLLGVQNTYISAFQSLGALGLLLGTFGLVAAQLRSVLERQSELALMQAVGFSKQRIAKMLTLETALLLGGGLLIGILTAALALVPYVIQTGPELSTLNPLLMLLVVLACGFIAALIAVRAAAKKSVLAGLRDE